MKKTYMTPTLKITKIETMQMLATSTLVPIFDMSVF